LHGGLEANMPHIRLIGLVLFITAIFLAMAAAATHTTHIRFKRFDPNADRFGSLNDFQVVDRTGAPANPTRAPTFPSTVPLPHGNTPTPPPAPVDGFGNNEADSDELLFISVPVVYPLAVACLLGLMMWFVPAPHARSVKKRRRRR
jgi:hypothetical protein